MQLPVERIAVTQPPRGWFHGVTFALYELYRQAGGAGGGGICSIGGPGRRAPGLGVVLGGMAAAWLLRRRGRRR